MSNVAKLKKQAAELELKKQFDKALAIYIKLLDSFDRERERARCRAVQSRRRPDAPPGQRGRCGRLLRTGRRPLRRHGLLQQRHCAVQQDPAALAGPGERLLQAREDQRAEGLQERRESQLPRVCRPDAEGRQSRRGVSGAERVRGSLSRPGRDPARCSRTSSPRPTGRPKRSSSCRSSTSDTTPRAASREASATAARMRAIDPSVEPRAAAAAAERARPAI